MVVAGGPSRSGLGRGGPADGISGMAGLGEERQEGAAVLPPGAAKLQDDGKIVHGGPGKAFERLLHHPHR